MEFLAFLYDATQYIKSVLELIHNVFSRAKKEYKAAYLREFEDIQYLSLILMIVDNSENEHKALAVNILNKVVESDKAVKVIRKCFGFTILLNALNSANESHLKISILHLIKTLVQNEDNIQELRALGLINLLLLLFNYLLINRIAYL